MGELFEGIGWMKSYENFIREKILPETNSHFAPANRPKPNRKGSYSKHPFSGANC